MIKAVIYDLDDLMVNSAPKHFKATDILLQRYGHKYEELPDKLKTNFIGKRVIDVLKNIIGHFKISADLNELYRERMRIFLDLIRDELEAMPGLFKSLKLFKNKYKIALASSGTRKYIEFVLEKFEIENYFDVVVSGDDVKVGKPSPETYLIACKKLGLQPTECVVFEDAAVGVASAKSAGCKCIAIKNPYTPPQDLSEADLVLGSLDELTLKIVDSL